jgi:hypothetical protein
MTDEQIEALVLASPDMAQAIYHDIIPMGAFVALVRAALVAELNRCRYPACVENDDDRCPRWLTGECKGLN